MDFKNWIYSEQGTQLGAFSLNAAGRAGQKQYTPESPMSILLKRRRDSIVNKVVKSDNQSIKLDKLKLTQDFGTKGYAIPDLQAWKPEKPSDVKLAKSPARKTF